MKCVLCKHRTTYNGTINIALERDSCIIVVKAVPANLCGNCGEYYLSQSTTAAVLAAEKSIVGVAAPRGNRTSIILDSPGSQSYKFW